MLFFVFTVEAQNNETRKKSDNRKATNTSVNKSTSKSSSSKTRATKTTSPSSRNSAAKSSNSSSRSSANKSTNNSSRSNASKSSSSRNNSSAPARTAPPSRTKSDDINTKRPSRSSTQSTRSTTTTRTRTTGNSGSSASPTRATPPSRTQSNDIDARKSGASRTVDASNSRNRNTNNGNRSVNAQRSRSSNSVRGSYAPKTSVRNAESRRVYTTSRTHRVTRTAPKVHYTYHPIEYRRVHTPYRAPRTKIIYWDVHMHNNYRSWYSDYNLWYYPYGYRIHTISAYDAISYVGEIARVYGEVTEVWYSRESRQYYLYIGGPYPYNDFTVILESRDARRFSFDPVRFFTNRHISVTGLISIFDGKPEILVKKRKQVDAY